MVVMAVSRRKNNYSYNIIKNSSMFLNNFEV